MNEATLLKTGDPIAQADLDSVPLGRSIVGDGPDGIEVWMRSAAGWVRYTTGQRNVQTADLPRLEWVLMHRAGS